MEPETLHESSTRQKFHSYCLYLLVPAINIPRLVFQFFVVVPPRLGTGKKMNAVTSVLLIMAKIIDCGKNRKFIYFSVSDL